MVIFDLPIKVWEISRSFVNNLSAFRKERFQNICEPVFRDFNKIHEDYNRNLHTALRSLRKVTACYNRQSRAGDYPQKKISLVCQKAIHHAREVLEQNRLTNEPLRRFLRSYEGYQKRWNPGRKESSFFESLLNYFPEVRTRTFSTGFTYFINEMQPNSNIFNICQELEATIERHNQSWSEVCVNYQNLKAAVWKKGRI